MIRGLGKFTIIGTSRNKVLGRTGLNFINVLWTAFTSANSRSVKKTVKFLIFFTLLGSTSIKAVQKMLMKLTPDVARGFFVSLVKLVSFILVAIERITYKK